MKKRYSKMAMGMMAVIFILGIYMFPGFDVNAVKNVTTESITDTEQKTTETWKKGKKKTSTTPPATKKTNENSLLATTEAKKVKKLKLNCSSRIMVVGQDYQLKAISTPGMVTWKSSNKKIVRVDSDGIISAKKKGTAIITAKSGKQKKKCKIKVEKLHLTRTQMTVFVDDKNQAIDLVGCPHEVYWESSDESIAEVYDGKLTFYSKGNVTITATVHDESFDCEVTVK